MGILKQGAITLAPSLAGQAMAMNGVDPKLAGGIQKSLNLATHAMAGKKPRKMMMLAGGLGVPVDVMQAMKGGPKAIEALTAQKGDAYVQKNMAILMGDYAGLRLSKSVNAAKGKK